MIQFTDEAIFYLDELILVLYVKEYFGFIESAEVYVERIYDFIVDNIENSTQRTTPINLKKLGPN